MSYFPHLLTLVGVWVVLTITPGPDFAVTFHYATTRSRHEGVFVALGVTTGLTIWITGSMAGLGVLFAHFSWLVEIIRTLGALYLTYLGIKMILNAHRLPLQKTLGVAPTRRFSAWRIGFFSNISNPKLAAFFSSLFAALLPPNLPLWVLGTMVVVMLVITASWLCIVACLSSLGPIVSFYRRAKRWIDYITGGLFVALGVRLVVER
jgi:threonine efflux protein